jgi:YYY domain-containing protein
VLVKLTGIQPTIAFNLAVPMLAGLTAAGVFSLGYNLAYRSPTQRSRAFTVGALAVLLVVFVGNLAGFTQLVNMLSQHGGSGFESSIPGLQAAVRALAGLKSVLVDGTRLAPYNYWDPSRVIPDTINEFPYWSFLFADLHPHMIGIPFTVLFLSLAYARLRPGSGSPLQSQAGDYESPDLAGTAHSLGAAAISDTGAVFPPPEGAMRRFTAEVRDSLQDLSLGSIVRWLVLPFCLGALAVINTWDLPTYLGVITLVFWLTRYRRISQGVTRTGPLDGTRLLVSIIEAAIFGGITLAASYLLYRPFFTHYQPLDVGLGLVHDKTDLGQFIKIWGLPLFIAVSYLLLRLLYPSSRLGVLRTLSLFLRRWNVAPHLFDMHSMLVRRTGLGHWMALWSLAGVVGLTVGFWVLGYHVPALLLPLVWLAFLLLLRPDTDEGETFAGLLLFTGLLLLLGVEFFFLRDFLGGGAYYRMNTLFKFYIQVWVMLGVTAAFLLPSIYSWLWTRSSDGVHKAARARWTAVNLAWQGGVTLLMVAVLTYPLLGTPTRVRDRFDYSPPVGTLDGMAYMTVGTLVWPQGNPINLEYDYQAIRWLQANVKGTPVVAEAKVGYYREGGMRVSAYTGLPMPLGGLHQSEQRWPDEVGQRDGLYTEFWNTPDTERAWQLIKELNISYVYIGQLELSLYNPNLSSLVGQWSLNPGGFYKFDQLVAQGRLTVAYQNEHTRIYHVVDR